MTGGELTGGELTARVASVVFAGASVWAVLRWLSDLPMDKKYRTGVFRWRG